MTRSLPCDDGRAAVARLDIGDEDELGDQHARFSGSRTTKHFWLLRMVARMTSDGIDRNWLSKEPISGTGHSTRPETSSSSSSSSTTS